MVVEHGIKKEDLNLLKTVCSSPLQREGILFLHCCIGDVVKEKGGDDGDTCDSGLEETVGNEEDISGALESWEALDTNDSEEVKLNL